MGKTQGGQQRSKSPSPQGNQFLSLENIENREVLWGECQGFSMDGQINPGINGEPSWKVEWCTPGISTNGFFGFREQVFLNHTPWNGGSTKQQNGQWTWCTRPPFKSSICFLTFQPSHTYDWGRQSSEKLRNFTQNFHKTPFNLILNLSYSCNQ